MERYVRLRQRIASVNELLDVTAAMRSLAAVRVQRAQDALAGIRQYTSVVADAMADALPLLSPEAVVRGGRIPADAPGRRGLLVFASEHGFVGTFNERLLDRAQKELSGDDDSQLYMVGGRGALVAEERGLDVDWAVSMATHPGQVIDVAQRVAMGLYRRFVLGNIVRIDLLFARYRSGGSSDVERLRLLPIDLRTVAGRPSVSPPLLNLPPAALVERLVEEYFFAELSRAAMESFTSENGARLQIMDSAHETVEDKLDELGSEARRARQDEVTTELIDVVTGAEALRDHR